MKKLLFTIVMGLLISNLNAQKLEPTSHIWVEGTADNFKGGYTFSYATSGTPWNGSLISFGGFDNNYDTQISSDYWSSHISFRTKNGDANTWNPWIELATKGANDFVGNQSIQGNLGVGTNNPLAKLDVSGGNLLIRNIENVDGVSSIMVAHSVNISNFDTTGTSIRSITQNAGSNNYGLQFFTEDSHLTGQTEKMRILGNGNVGIGESNPENKLDVKGIIHSQEVNVDMDNWSDFVFKKEYNLPTLQEVEKHIAEKGHLENIPSEEEVLKNGINLGEMNAKLLQKIEEMTLYMIEMKKEIELLKKNQK